MNRHHTLVFGVFFALAGGVSAAPLPAAPPGFTWQFAGSNSYTDSDTGTLSLNASGNFGTPSVTPIGVSLSLTTFNENSAPPSQFYCVTSSTFSTSLIASTNINIFNFSGANDSFYGTLTLAGLAVGGSSTASAGPVTSSLNRTVGTAQPVPAFGVASFLDFATGANATNVSLTDTGTVPANNGNNITFSFSGNSVAFLQSSGNYIGALWSAQGAASYDASITTFYDVYDLVPVPEPGIALLGASALLSLISRRRR